MENILQLFEELGLDISTVFAQEEEIANFNILLYNTPKYSYIPTLEEYEEVFDYSS